MSNPSAVLAVWLLVASAFGQETASQVNSTWQATSFVFSAPDSQTVTFYTTVPHDGHFIEIKKGEKVIFSITPDGKSEHTEEYKPDAVTVQFWKDLTDAYADVCKVKPEASR